jgi:hypothetical protein
VTIAIPPPGTWGTGLRGAPIWHLVMGLSTGLYRLLGGRLIGRSLLLLTTLGARSGRQRTAMLFRFTVRPGSRAATNVLRPGNAS